MVFKFATDRERYNMIKEARFKDCIITIITEKGHKDIDMGISIFKIVHTKQYVVVLLNGHDLLDTQNHNRNIVCLDEEGQLVWRVSNPDLVSLSKERTHNYFTVITLKNERRIEAFKWDGFLVNIDIRTGEFVSKWTFTK